MSGMNGQKSFSVLTVVMLVVLSVSGGLAWYNTYKIKDFSQTSPGEWKFYFLQGGEFGRLVIEFDWVHGEEANGSAVNLLKEVAGEHIDKPGGIDAAFSDEIQQKDTDTDYNLSQLEGLEAKYRDYKPDPFKGELTIYILYLNGRYRNESNYVQRKVLGVTYRASSIAIFKDPVWSGEFGPLAWRREAAVLVHEFGHLLGLVNIGYKSAADHENYTLEKINNTFVRNYTSHCNDPHCVMYPEIEHQMGSPIVAQNYSTEFCKNCTADLAALKGLFDGKLATRYLFALITVSSAIIAVGYVYIRVRKRGGIEGE